MLARFDYKCVECLERATDPHEIVPRSRDPHRWRRASNRVALCKTHHRQVHHEGTRRWEKRLRERQRFVLDLLA